MKKFNIHKLKSKKILIKSFKNNGKLTYLEVYGGKEKTIQLRKEMFLNFRKKYSITSFETPKMGAIATYNGVVFGVELAPLYIPEEYKEEVLKNWKPNSEKNIKFLRKKLIKTGEEEQDKKLINKKTYFDGCKIFYFDEKNIDTKHPKIKLNRVSRINLFAISQEEDKFSFKKADYVFSIKNNDKTFFSPVVNLKTSIYKSDETATKMVMNEETQEEESVEYKKSVFDFEKIKEKEKFSLYYITTLFKKIGDIYGHKKVDFLCIPLIMLSLKMNSFSRIPEHELKSKSIDKNVFATLAWLIDMHNSEKRYYKKYEIYTQINKIANGSAFVEAELLNPFNEKENGEKYKGHEILFYTDYELEKAYNKKRSTNKRKERKVFSLS